MSVISEICIAERATIDEKDPWTLKRVKLLGKTSGNKRTYPRAIQEAAKPLFNNKKIYIDHGDLDGKYPINRKRSYAERLGIVVNGTVTVDTITESTYADVRLNPKHPLAEMVKSDYENETPGVGFSIAADCRFPGNQNIGECLGIERIFSIDLVDDPATAISLTEAMAAEAGEYEKGKEHGEMASKLEKHEQMLAEHARKHEEHQARLDGHESRISYCEANMAKTVEQFNLLGGPEHESRLKEFQDKQAAAEKAVAEANKLISEAKESFKKVPRTPNTGNPLEKTITLPAPITNGVGLVKSRFNKN